MIGFPPPGLVLLPSLCLLVLIALVGLARLFALAIGAGSAGGNSSTVPTSPKGGAMDGPTDPAHHRT